MRPGDEEPLVFSRNSNSNSNSLLKTGYSTIKKNNSHKVHNSTRNLHYFIQVFKPIFKLGSFSGILLKFILKRIKWLVTIIVISNLTNAFKEIQLHGITIDVGAYYSSAEKLYMRRIYTLQLTQWRQLSAQYLHEQKASIHPCVNPLLVHVSMWLTWGDWCLNLSEFEVIPQKCSDLSVAHLRFSNSTSNVSFGLVLEEPFDPLNVIFLWEIWRLASRGKGWLAAVLRNLSYIRWNYVSWGTCRRFLR